MHQFLPVDSLSPLPILEVRLLADPEDLSSWSKHRGEVGPRKPRLILGKPWFPMSWPKPIFRNSTHRGLGLLEETHWLNCAYPTLCWFVSWDSFPNLGESVLGWSREMASQRERRDTQPKEASAISTEFTSGQRLDQGKRANIEAKGGSVFCSKHNPGVGQGHLRLCLAAFCPHPPPPPLLSWGRALPRVQLPTANSIIYNAWFSRQNRQDTNCSLLIEDDSGISNLSPRPDCPTERGEEERGGEGWWPGMGRGGRDTGFYTTSGRENDAGTPWNPEGWGFLVKLGASSALGSWLALVNLISWIWFCLGSLC